MSRWTQSDLDAVRLKLSEGNKRGMTRGDPKASKYKNKRTYEDGRWFSSKKEANYYLQLKMAKAMNQIRGFACQVSVPLPSGKRRMIIDFMLVELDGRVRWIDVKGFATPEWKTKQVELEHSLGIQIETV